MNNQKIFDLWSITPMNNQEVFDTAVPFLLKQNARSSYSGGNCYYRSPNGRKCAIGACIPDELYLPEMDNESGLTITALCIEYDFIRKLFSDCSNDFLREMQIIHDTHLPAEWKIAYTVLGERWGLDISCLK